MMFNWAALPQPLLELILTMHTTSSNEVEHASTRKALRQTCRLFHNTLDSNMTSVLLEAWSGSGRSTWYIKSCIDFLKRMQLMRSCQEVAIIGDTCYGFHKLFGYLPTHLNTLELTGPVESLNLEPLNRLECLTLLRIKTSDCEVEGLEYVTGLTRLEAMSSLRSVAHLAPTMRHLEINGTFVSDFNKLTNLEGLVLRGTFDWIITSIHKHLPLRYMLIDLGYGRKRNFANQHVPYELPPTLTKLGLRYTYSDTSYDLSDVLTSSITYLQLLNNPTPDVIETVATALPGLKCLEFYISGYWKDVLFSEHISKFTSLKTLRMSDPCLYGDKQNCPLDQIWSDLHELEAAVTARGVKVEFVKFKKVFEDVFFHQESVRTSWRS